VEWFDDLKLCRWFRAAGNEKYLKGAVEAARFILQEMKKDGRLMRVFHKGKSRVTGYSEDYAFLIQALIDLYEATFEMEWLKEADDLNRRMIDHSGMRETEVFSSREERMNH